MKKMYLVASLILVGLAMSACQKEAGTTSTVNNNASSTASPAGKDDPKTIDEFRAVLQKHDKALNDKNIDALMTTFSSDPKTVVLGTGEGERYVGQQAIKEAYTEMLKDYDPGTLTTNCEWRTGGADTAGTTAWVAATCAAQDSLKNVKRDYVLNVSGALRREGDGWRFVMLHMSNATSNAPPVAANMQSAPAK